MGPNASHATTTGSVQWVERTNVLWKVPRIADATIVRSETMDPTTRTGSELPRRTMSSYASLAVYGMSPVAIAAFWWLRSAGLIADTPVWKLVIALAVCGVANFATGIGVSRTPGSRMVLHARVAVVGHRHRRRRLPDRLGLDAGRGLRRGLGRAAANGGTVELADGPGLELRRHRRRRGGDRARMGTASDRSRAGPRRRVRERRLPLHRHPGARSHGRGQGGGGGGDPVTRRALRVAHPPCRRHDRRDPVGRRRDVAQPGRRAAVGLPAHRRRGHPLRRDAAPLGADAHRDAAGRGDVVAGREPHDRAAHASS